MTNKQNNKKLFIYIKGLKFFYFLIFKFISKWNGQSFNIINNVTKINNNKLYFPHKNNHKYISNIREYIKSLIKFESNNAYSFSNNYNYKFSVYNNKLPKNINIFLEYSFLSLFYLISKPFFEITPDKIIIHLFCFQIKPLKKNFIDNVSMLTKKINRIKLQIISRILRKILKKTVELEIVRLHYPFYNTNIFVNLLGKMVNKIKFRRILRQFFNKAKIFNPTIANIPSFISGIKFKIAGRLLTQRIVPRQTVKIISRGSLARSKVIYLEKGRFNNKNKRGAFSITVITGHIISLRA
jgi:hypothetical protein